MLRKIRTLVQRKVELNPTRSFLLTYPVSYLTPSVCIFLISAPIISLSFLVPLFYHSENSSNGNGFTGFIVNIHQPFYDPLRNVLGVLFFLRDLLLACESHANRASHVHRFRKTAFVDAIVKQHRAFLCIDKKPCRLTEYIIPVRHTAG